MRWVTKTSMLPLLAAIFFGLLVSCSSEPAKLEIGDKAPGFVLKDLQGHSVQLSDHLGSPVVLRFFLTDCKFCQADTPVFNDFYTRYNDKGLRMFYIDTLGVEHARLADFAKEFELAFPILLDTGANVASTYKVRALPQTMVLDPYHRIIAAILGGVSEEELNSLLLPYLK